MFTPNQQALCIETGGDYKRTNGQLQNSGQLQNNVVNGATSITINSVINVEIISTEINYTYAKLCQPHVTLSITKEITRSQYRFHTGNLTEAAALKCSVEKVFLEIPQNLQENTCTRGSFLRKRQALAQNTFFTEHPLWLLLTWKKS